MLIINQAIKLNSDGQYIYNIAIHTYQEWLSDNPVVPEGVLAYCSDNNELRIGDGTNTWFNLPLANTYNGIDDCPNTNDLYVKVNGRWCVLDEANKTALYPSKVISAEDIPNAVTSEWETGSVPIDVSNVYLTNNLIYIPSIRKLIASSNTTTDNLFYSDDGLNWTNFNPVGRNWNTYITSLYYIPEKDLVVTYYSNTDSYFSIWSINTELNLDSILTLEYSNRNITLDGTNVLPNELNYYNNNLYVTTANRTVGIYNLNNSNWSYVSGGNPFSKIFYNNALVQYYGITYNSSPTAYQRTCGYSLGEDLGQLTTSGNLNYGYRRTMMCQVDDVIYAYVQDVVENSYKIIAISDIVNNQVITAYTFPSAVSGTLYRFDYIKKAGLFYIISSDNIFFSKDLTNWWSKTLPTGMSPSSIMYNSMSSIISVVYVEHLHSVVFLNSASSAVLNIEEVL